MKNKVVKKKYKFTNKLQKKFLLFSEDYNPIHVNRNYSKVFFEDKKVVYGALIIIKSLSLLSKSEIDSIKTVKVNFIKPIFVDQDILIEIRKNKYEYQILIFEKKDVKVHIIFNFNKKNNFQINGSSISLSLKNLNLKNVNSNLKKKYIIETENINLKSKSLNEFKLKDDLLNELGFLSYFIGSVYPGHGAIISNIELNMSDLKVNNLKKKYQIQLKYFNKKINSSIILIKRKNSFKITTFFLPKKKKDHEFKYLKKKIKNKEFKNSKSLIIGGSRGLGLATSKILIFGGADVYITYRKNFVKLKKELSSFSNFSKKIKFIKYDINNAASYKRLNKLNINNIFYFATPKIFIEKKDIFEKSNFENFNNYYIYKFFEICRLFEKNKKKIKVFFPSTNALNKSNFLNLNEYSMSKSAAEILIKNLNKFYDFVKISILRLPRIDTDQTANIMKIKSLNPTKKMIPLIKKFLAHND